MVLSSGLLFIDTFPEGLVENAGLISSLAEYVHDNSFIMEHTFNELFIENELTDSPG